MSVLKVHRYNNIAFSSDFLLEGTYLKLRFVTKTFWIKIQKNSHSTASTVQKAHQAQRKSLRRKRSVVHARTYVRRRELRAALGVRRRCLRKRARRAHCAFERRYLPRRARRFRKALSPARRCAARSGGGDYATTVVPQRLPSVLLTCCSALCCCYIRHQTILFFRCELQIVEFQASVIHNDPHWHELWKQEECSYLARPRGIFNKTQ